MLDYAPNSFPVTFVAHNALSASFASMLMTVTRIQVNDSYEYM
jgi:hypothetical protein